MMRRTRPIRIGLTGSLGMGKSTTARLFAAQGVPVFDADAAVHDLFAKDTRLVAAIQHKFPGVVAEGKIDRGALGRAVLGVPEQRRWLEDIVHPRVRMSQAVFARRTTRRGAPFILFDIPLLFEAGGWRNMDFILVVSAPEKIQKARVLERKGMSEERFYAILGSQMPDTEKRARAHAVLMTDAGAGRARRHIRSILRYLRRKHRAGTRTFGKGRFYA